MGARAIQQLIDQHQRVKVAFCFTFSNQGFHFLRLRSINPTRHGQPGGGGVTLCSPFLLRVYPLNHLLFVSFLELQKARTFVSGKLEETVSAF